MKHTLENRADLVVRKAYEADMKDIELRPFDYTGRGQCAPWYSDDDVKELESAGWYPYNNTTYRKDIGYGLEASVIPYPSDVWSYSTRNRLWIAFMKDGVMIDEGEYANVVAELDYIINDFIKSETAGEHGQN